jgi:hypothetical protein
LGNTLGAGDQASVEVYVYVDLEMLDRKVVNWVAVSRGVYAMGAATQIIA